MNELKDFVASVKEVMSAQLSLFTLADLDALQDELDREHPNPRPFSKRAPRRLREPGKLEALFTYEDELAPLPQRPKCRRECIDGPRPCPWVGCRYNLYLDVNEDTGAIKFNQFKDELVGLDADGKPITRRVPLEPWEMTHSCALDVVDAGGGDPLRLADLGELIDVGPERARQLVNEALGAAREVAEAWGLADLFDSEDE